MVYHQKHDVLQGTIVDMLEDVNTGIGWVLQKISNYGGDPERVYLVGQSCGGQLCSLATLIQVHLLKHTWAFGDKFVVQR